MYQSNLYGIETKVVLRKHENQKCINRTFMELKRTKFNGYTLGISVSIEPLWNWNGKALFIHSCIICVSIEPLWNWNFVSPILYDEVSCINRTFMELKLGWY